MPRSTPMLQTREQAILPFDVTGDRISATRDGIETLEIQLRETSWKALPAFAICASPLGTFVPMYVYAPVSGRRNRTQSPLQKLFQFQFFCPSTLPQLAF